MAVIPLIDSEQWRTVRLSVLNEVVRVIVDDVETMTFEDTSPLPAGYLSFSGTAWVEPVMDGVQITHRLLADDIVVFVPASEWLPSPTPTTEIIIVPLPTAIPSLTVTPTTEITAELLPTAIPSLTTTPIVFIEVTPELTAEMTEVVIEATLTAIPTETLFPVEVTDEVEVVPSSPILPFIFSDSFDSGDLSAWEIGAGWTLVPRTIVNPPSIEITPESTLAVEIAPERPPEEKDPQPGIDPEVTLEMSLPGEFPTAIAPFDLVMQAAPMIGTLVPRQAALGDMIVEADVSVLTGSLVVALRQSETGAYHAVLSADATVTLYRNEVVVAYAVSPLLLIDWQRVRVSVIANTVQIMVGGLTVVEYVDAEPLPSGTIMFGSAAPEVSLVQIDNVTVYGEATPTLVAEPVMETLYEDTFDNPTLRAWMFESFWMNDFSDTSMAIENRTGEFAMPLKNALTDFAAELRFSIRGGQAALRFRQSDVGEYQLTMDQSGLVNLYRNNILLDTASTAAFDVWQWRSLRISMVGNTIRVSVDGVEILIAVDSQPLPAGTISFGGVFSNGDVSGVLRIDSYRVAVPVGMDIQPNTLDFSEVPELAEVEAAALNREINAAQSVLDFPYPLEGWVAYTDWEGGVASEEIRIANIADGNGETDEGIKVIGSNGIGYFDGEPTISPDGRNIAFISNCDGNLEIYVLNLADLTSAVDPCVSSTQIRKLTNTASNTVGQPVNRYPVWSPDGTRIAFINNAMGDWKLFIVDVFGDSTQTPLRLIDTAPGIDEVDPSFSPDGRYLAFRSASCTNDYDIYKVRVDVVLGANLALEDITCSRLTQEATEATETTEAVESLMLIADQGDDLNLSWSPDGRLIAYNAYRTSTSHIFVRSAAGTFFANAQLEINVTASFQDLRSNGLINWGPSWSPDMTQIVFASNVADGGLTTRVHVVQNIDYTDQNALSFTVDPQARTAHGFWLYNGPDWSQYLTCSDYDEGIRFEIPSENQQGVPVTIPVPRHVRRACLLGYVGAIAIALFNETSGDSYKGTNQIETLLEEYDLSQQYLGIDENIRKFASIIFHNDHRYLFAMSNVNGLINSANTSPNPTSHLSTSYECATSARQCVNEAAGGPGPVGPNTTQNGRPYWLGASGNECNITIGPLKRVNLLTGEELDTIFCRDRVFYANEVALWSDPAHNFHAQYMAFLPYIIAAIQDNTLGIDPLFEGINARITNVEIRNDDDTKERIVYSTTYSLANWVDNQKSVTDLYMEHLDVLYAAQGSECIVPIQVASQFAAPLDKSIEELAAIQTFFSDYPLRATNNDPTFRYHSAQAYDLPSYPGNFFPSTSSTQFGLTNDAMHVHTLRFERPTTNPFYGPIEGFTWTTYIFQFGSEAPAVPPKVQTTDLASFSPADGIRSSTFPANPALWTLPVRYINESGVFEIGTLPNVVFELIISPISPIPPCSADQ